jgi:hypothetical protein
MTVVSETGTEGDQTYQPLEQRVVRRLFLPFPKRSAAVAKMAHQLQPVHLATPVFITTNLVNICVKS